MFEILMGDKVESFDVDGCHNTLFAHKDCLKKYAGRTLDVTVDLPESSPLRIAFERAKAQPTKAQPTKGQT